MTRKTHPMVRALLLHAPKIYFGAGLLIVGIVLVSDAWWGAALIATGALLMGYGAVRVLKVVQHEQPERAHPIPSDLPLDDRIAILRRGLWLMPLILLPLSAWAAWDLYRLETGRVAEITLWSVIGDIYEYYGFWPAILFVPAGTVLFELFLMLGIRQLRREARARSVHDADAA